MKFKKSLYIISSSLLLSLGANYYFGSASANDLVAGVANFTSSSDPTNDDSISYSTIYIRNSYKATKVINGQKVVGAYVLLKYNPNGNGPDDGTNGSYANKYVINKTSGSKKLRHYQFFSRKDYLALSGSVSKNDIKYFDKAKIGATLLSGSPSKADEQMIYAQINNNSSSLQSITLNDTSITGNN